MKYISKNILNKVYKKRPPESHKYDFGYLLVIGGSKLYSGSPALCAMSAFRAGVDLTLVIAPERAANIIASFSPNLITYSLDGSDLAREHLPEIFSLAESAKRVANGKVAFAIGGGAGRDEETEKAIIDYISKINIPGVIDADGIWAVAKKKEILKGKNFILTPHSYEFYVLTGINLSQKSISEKIDIVKKTAKNLGTTILLKGNPDIISDGKEVFLNKTGCPEMTVGGTGDVLTGICGTFLAQGFSPLISACASAFINGRAGELAKKKFGSGLTAEDLLGEIPNVIR